jgi:hypothetical protein
MIKNSFVSLSEQIIKLQNNSMEVLAALNRAVSSDENELKITTLDQNDLPTEVSIPTLGRFKSEIEQIKNTLRTLSTVDSRGAVIQPARNEFKKIIAVSLNQEPNQIGELETITNFYSDKNHFFDALLNPILKIRLNLTGKIDQSAKKILSRRYIVNFTLNEEGNPNEEGLEAIELFNENFKNRTDVTVSELETWINNTPGIRVNKATGRKIVFDEQEFNLKPNRLEFEGFFTILGSDEDIVNRKLYYILDTLNYFEVDSGTKRTLEIGDELIINSNQPTTRYRIAEINKDASELRVLFERVEGFEPIPVGIVGGMKYYSGLIDEKIVDISIGFDEYNVVFVKSINTETNIISRNFSSGVAFYTNDLLLSSRNNTGDDGRLMSDYYIQTVNDFGRLLKDLVDRYIPRSLGIKPNAPVLDGENFRVIQANRYLTDTPDNDANRQRHQQIRTLRSKIDEISKTVQEKRRELATKTFRNPKDRLNVQNQIDGLVNQSETDTQELNNIVNDLLGVNQNKPNINPIYKVQGFWQIPLPQQDNKTRPQEIIAFRVQYKKSSVNGQENNNEVFRLTAPDGGEINAVFSPWEEYITPVRDRIYNQELQKFVWVEPDLSSIDQPNINSVNLTIEPTERIEIRVKAISEVGYPESILESDWSNIFSIGFPDELLQARNPQELIIKNAELESVRNRIESDFDRLNLSEHLSDGITIENKYYPHITDNIGFKQENGNVISLTDRLSQINQSDDIQQLTDLALQTPWTNYGQGYNNAQYYRHEGRVYLRGVVRVDRGDNFSTLKDRFFKSVINSTGANKNLTRIAFLPEGYRPKNKEIMIVYTDNTNKSGVIEILPNGLVQASDVNSSLVSLDNLSFRL